MSISYSSSPLSVKLCPMSVHQSVKELEFYSLVSRRNTHIIHYKHIWEGCSCLSVKYTPPTLVSISSSPSPLPVKLCSMSIHQSVQELEFYSLVSRLKPTSYTIIGIFGRAVVGCPSDAHLQLWCLSAPAHHLCLLTFVPCASIDPFKI